MPIYDDWLFPPPAAGIASSLPIHPALAGILVRRGIDNEASYRKFVAPRLEDLHDPSGIHGMPAACERIERAVRDGETIVIYGDYDVDGVTSIVLLQGVLRLLGADAAHVVPHRLVDGYGLKIEVLERVLAERNMRLVITVDCGITSVEPVRRAIERGIDVIVTDHHLPPEVLPSAAAVLNPRQPGCEYPFKDLAGVGVAFKLCCELIRRAGKRISIESLLKLAAIGTVADVAPLTGENRTIAWLGLNALADPRNRGLRALLRRLGMLGRPLRAVDVGFRIGPRINAAGRLASANIAIDLFAAEDDDTAWQLCAELDRLNAERQMIEREVLKSAEELMDGVAATPRVLILAAENWHKGVLGLTAGRIAQKYHRPTLMLSIDNGLAVGSARSIPSIDLHAQLSAAGDLFDHFGGHEFACGFSLPSSRVDELRRRMTGRFDALDADLFRRDAHVDGVLTLAEIGREFVEAHELLQPFGAGNPQPAFAVRGVRVANRRPFGEDCCAMTITDGTAEAEAVRWPSAQPIDGLLGGGAPCDVLCQIEPDASARSGARLTLLDARNSLES